MHSASKLVYLAALASVLVAISLAVDSRKGMCETVEPGDVLDGSTEKLYCAYSDPRKVTCSPSKGQAFVATFDVDPPLDPSKIFGQINKVTLTNTKDARGTTSKQRKVYAFSTGNQNSYYYLLKGYSKCSVTRNEFDDFSTPLFETVSVSDQFVD